MAPRDKKSSQKRSESSGNSEIMERLKTRPALFIGSVFILVLIVIAFVFMPALVPGSFQDSNFVFGTFNKIPIRHAQNNYFHRVQMEISQFYQSMGMDLNDLNVIYAVFNRAFEEAVIHTGILDEMGRAGFTAPEDVVDREVARLPRFQENGRFSAARYRAMDNNARLNLWRETQENIALRYYMMDLLNLKAPSNEAAFVASMSSPRRSFDMVSFDILSYPDTEVISFAMANPGLFTQVHLSIISIGSSEREARQVYNAVRDGIMSFEEAARNNSQDMFADRSGDMGIRTAYELRWEISDDAARESVINLPQGQMSDLISVPGGWVFFRANQAPRPIDLSDDIQINGVRNYIMANLRGRVEDWSLAEAERFAAQARTIGFDEAARAEGLERQSFGPIPINFGNTALFAAVASAGVPELAGAGSNQFFWDLAFSTPLNTVSIPRVIGNSIIVLYPLEEIYLDEEELTPVVNYFPEWVGDGFEAMYRSYFLNNAKLDNRFDETFSRIFLGTN